MLKLNRDIAKRELIDVPSRAPFVVLLLGIFFWGENLVRVYKQLSIGKSKNRQTSLRIANSSVTFKHFLHGRSKQIVEISLLEADRRARLILCICAIMVPRQFVTFAVQDNS